MSKTNFIPNTSTITEQIYGFLPIVVVLMILYGIVQLFMKYNGTNASDWTGMEKFLYFLYLFFYIIGYIIMSMGLVAVFGVFGAMLISNQGGF